MKKTHLGCISAALLIASPLASAHVGVHGLHNSFMEGFVHPFFGLDHLVMLLAMGFVARQANSVKKGFMLLASVLSFMFAGVLLGELSGAITGMETLILGSLFVVAATMWKMRNKETNVANTVLLSLSVTLVLFHGWAHGVELGGAVLMEFAPGMLLASTIIVSLGYQLARFIPTRFMAPVVAASGACIALLG